MWFSDDGVLVTMELGGWRGVGEKTTEYEEVKEQSSQGVGGSFMKHLIYPHNNGYENYYIGANKFLINEYTEG